MFTHAMSEQQRDGPHQHAECRPDAIGQLALDAFQAQRPLHVGRIVRRIGRPQFGGQRVETILRLRAARCRASVVPSRRV